MVSFIKYFLYISMLAYFCIAGKEDLFLQFPDYEVVWPKIHQRAGDLRVVLQLSAKVLTLTLTPNHDLLSPSYLEKFFDQGQSVVRQPQVPVCLYHGHVVGQAESSVALSTCTGGLRGMISGPDFALHLEPAHEGAGLHAKHFLFKQTHQYNFTCGVKSHDAVPSKQSRRERRSPRWPYNANRNTKIVEMYIVNDHSQFLAMDSNVTKTIERTKEIINVASSLFLPINIQLALVGVEVWAERDLVVIESHADNTMNNFLEYRRLHISPQHPNDNAQLITAQKFEEGVIGKAPINTICSWQFSGGVNRDHNNLVGPIGTTLAHELGHNFGLAHDKAGCGCKEDRCIMNSTSGFTQPMSWSTCSMEQFADAFFQGMDYCLHNLPSALYQGSVCGNGFLEDQEECDCGLPQVCSSKCCNATTCRLFANATCATGTCCNQNTCQFKAISSPCRPARGICDLAEYCLGQSEFCPVDTYRSDGTVCQVAGSQSYCYRGQCHSHESQCRLLWGPTASDSYPSCYIQHNSNGDASGNCGYFRTNKTYVTCSPTDVRCGMLHCHHTTEKLAYWREALALVMPVTYVEAHRYTCQGAILDVGLDMPDPGMVPDGSKCATGHLCVQQHCVPINGLGVKACPDCHGHGVCDQLGQCYCDVGFKPPTCQDHGNGGSLTSGPIQIYTGNVAYIVSLVIFVLVILPLLMFALIFGYRYREQLKHCWQRHTSYKYRCCLTLPQPTVLRAKPDRPTALAHSASVRRTASFTPADISSPRLKETTNHQGLATMRCLSLANADHDAAPPPVPPRPERPVQRSLSLADATHDRVALRRPPSMITTVSEHISNVPQQSQVSALRHQFERPAVPPKPTR